MWTSWLGKEGSATIVQVETKISKKDDCANFDAPSMDVKQRCPHEILVPSLSTSNTQSIHEDVEMEEIEFESKTQHERPIQAQQEVECAKILLEMSRSQEMHHVPPTSGFISDRTLAMRFQESAGAHSVSTVSNDAPIPQHVIQASTSMPSVTQRHAATPTEVDRGLGCNDQWPSSSTRPRRRLCAVGWLYIYYLSEMTDNFTNCNGFFFCINDQLTNDQQLTSLILSEPLALQWSRYRSWEGYKIFA